MLTEQEKIRYKRHFLLEGWDEEKQEKMKNTTVFVAGAGGTGSPTITMLALMGVGCIRICDFDIFEESNKNRQFIHCLADERLGMNKAKSAALTVHSLNPNVRVEYVEEKIEASNVDQIVGDAQMIFDCLDRFRYKFVLADCAMRKNIPLFFYGIMDYNNFAYLFYPPKTACFHCLFDEKKIRLLDQMGSRKADVAAMSPALFSAAGIMMTEAAKLLVGFDEPDYNSFLLSFGKRHDVSEQRGVRAFGFWNTSYFRESCRRQGFDWKNCEESPRFLSLSIPADPNCPHCRALQEAAASKRANTL